MMARVHAFLRVASHTILVSAGVVLLFPVLAAASALFLILSHSGGTGTLPADCAVVFGAAVYGLDRPGPAITRRVGTAAAYYREGRINRLILSGGKGRGNRQSEAQVMKTAAVEGGVDPVDILLEQRSHSTWENLAYARNLTSDCSSVVGISDGFHLARIRLLAKRQGWEALHTVPAVIRPTHGAEWRGIAREVLAYVYYGLRLDSVIALPRGTNDFPTSATD